MDYPITKSLKISKLYTEIPEIIDLHFDLHTLKIELEFMKSDNITLICENVQGFRVLDEEYLMEFWNDRQSDGWIWKIIKGGWYDQEKLRDGFLIGELLLEEFDEYMVVEIGKCVNLISDFEPIIYKP